MKVLKLVTTPRPFFEDQCRVLRQQGIELTILQLPERKQKNSRSLFDYARFYSTVLKNSIGDFDIVHANYGLTAPHAIAQPTRPIVLSLWGSDLMGKYGNVSDHCAKYFDTVILPTQSMAQHISTDYIIVPFGIDTDKFKPIDKKKAREKIGWEQTDTIVLFPYPKSREIKRFDLAQSIIDSIDKQIQLQTLPGVPHDKVPLYMNASDAVFVTSRRESGPMVIKEAALCNVPVVSTNVGFASEVLSNVENSYVCRTEKELKDRLEAVLESGERSDGRKHSDEWGLDKMSERFIDVYESVLER